MHTPAVKIKAGANQFDKAVPDICYMLSIFYKWA